MRSKLHETGAKMSTTYTTEQIARLAGLHPNTVRKYEERELIQKPQRKENGYRIYTENDMNRLRIIFGRLQLVL